MNDGTHSQDALLDRAIASLRSDDIPPGPSESLKERALNALDREIDCSARSRRRWADVGVAAALAASLLFVQTIRVMFRPVRGVNQQTVRINTPSPTPGPPVSTRQPDQHRNVTPAVPGPRVLVASEISIRGRVFFHGPHPARRLIDTDSCPQCSQVTDGPLYDDSLVISDDGAIQNVVVSISAGLPPGARFSIPQEPVVLNQKGCMFRPHVIATMVGQAIEVKNSDPLLHSVHSMDAEQSPAFDFAQPTLGSRRVEPLQVVETFQVKCDLHPWMSAWVRVFNHPYFAVTGADGSFTIPPLPPGTYRVKAWHELLGVREKMIEVRQGAPVKIDFTFDR
jgi:hypothetical protein